MSGTNTTYSIHQGDQPPSFPRITLLLPVKSLSSKPGKLVTLYHSHKYNLHICIFIPVSTQLNFLKLDRQTNQQYAVPQFSKI